MALESGLTICNVATSIDSTSDTTLNTVSNVLTDDSNYTYWTIDTGLKTIWLCDILEVRSFLFDIPQSARILGIEVEIKREYVRTGPFPSSVVVAYDAVSTDPLSGLSLILNGTRIGNAKRPFTAWGYPGTETVTFGGSTDTWGTTLTVNDIKSSSFGVRIKPLLDGDAGTYPQARIYYVKVNIHYEETEGPAGGLTNQTTVLDQSGTVTKKSVHYKFYTPDDEYVTSLTQDDFIEYPSFSMNINDGLSRLALRTKHSLDDIKYDSTGIITKGNETINTIKGSTKFKNAMKFGNICRVYISDKEGLNIPIYSGYVGGYEYQKTNNAIETLSFEILPNVARLSALVTKDASENTTVTYNSIDPADMAKFIVAQLPVTLEYDDTTIYDVGVSRTYSFISLTVKESFNKIIDLCPYGWFYYVGEDDAIYLKDFFNSAHTTTHRIHESKITSLNVVKSIYNLRNRMYFLGGGDPQLYEKYDKSGSQSAYGLFEELQVDERVTESSTAESISNRFLTSNEKPSSSVIIEVMDSNFSENRGMDIENFNVGDTIIVYTEEFDDSVNLWNQFTWGQDIWGYSLIDYGGVPFYIQSYTYKYDRIVLNCVFDLPMNENRIEDINRDLRNFRFKDAPSSPS